MNEYTFTPDETAVLGSIEKSASQGGTLDEAGALIFPELRRIVPCERLDIGLIEENGRRVEIRHVHADYDPLEVKPAYIADMPPALFEGADRSVSHIIDDLDKHDFEDEHIDLYDRLRKDGIRSLVVVPVVSGGIIGLMACSSRSAGAFSGRHGALLEEVARILRYSVEKEYQADQIDKHYRAYMEMLSFVSHELKSPVSSMVTLIRTLADGYYGKMDEKQREILMRVVQKAEYLQAVSSQYLSLARFESKAEGINPQLVDFIDDIIEPTIEILMPQMDERSMKLEREYHDNIFPVRCDPGLVKIVLMNLLGNAIKYGNRGGLVRITLSKGFKKFSVSVWNEGPGFSEQDKHRLFRKFSRLQSEKLVEKKGSGIGLYVSWKIVQQHCGRIFAESEQGSWARFTVELPQYQELCDIE
ncbi:MAG: GAF domain-containing sensor histidine kinase [Spirochaetes bacterium]|nr:GAF domain-containing sensor histidine kinase [Spirochaetota bacterium]